jgi:ADP-heptose:LPS heptosyltransferase
MTLQPISKLVKSDRFCAYKPGLTLNETIAMMGMHSVYVGNDTGMAHVATACGLYPIVINQIENAMVKSHPWCDDYYIFDKFEKQFTVEDVASKVLEALERTK